MLVALGLGWNCGVVGASTLLAASAPPRLRPHLEGIGEATMGVAAAIGAPLAGVALATAGLPVVWMAVGALAVAAAGADRAGNRSASVN
jgi:hypothetical protein